MQNDEPASAVELRQRGVSFRLFHHNGSVHSLEQAAGERGEQPEQVVRSIVFRLGEGSFIMVLMPGPAQVPWKALRRHLGQSRLSMASEEELLAATGYRPGTVNPFGLPNPMPVLVDQAVLDQPEVSLGSGIPGVAIIMHPRDLLAALNQPVIVTFSTESAT